MVNNFAILNNFVIPPKYGDDGELNPAWIEFKQREQRLQDDADEREEEQ